MRRIAVLLATLAIWPIAAQADELSEMKAALSAAMGSIHALQERVKVLEQEKHDKDATGSVGVRKTRPPVVVVRPAVPPPLVTAAPVVAPDLKPIGPVPEAEKARLEIHGNIQLDAIYDFKKVNPNWEGTLRPSQIPVNCPPVGFDAGCGKNGVTNFNVRASSVDIRGFLPTDAGEVKTRLAFDLWGGADQNQVRFRLTQAWASFGQWLFGYTDSIFMDGDVFPNVLDFWGPSGMMFVRDPQIRWTPWDAYGFKAVVGLEVPSAAIDEGKAAEFASCTPGLPFPCFAPPLDVLEKPRYPDITAHLRAEGPWGHVQLAGVARWVTFDTPTGINGNPSGTVFGYGGNLTALIKTWGDDAIKGQIAYGKPIATYSNDCCFDLAPNAALPPAHATALPLLNWFVYYDHWWSKQWSSSIGFSQNLQINSPGQFDTEQHIGYYASVNLLWYPIQNVTLGVEGLWGERVDISGAKGQDERVQFSARVKF
jgi:hypothetical protein